ncbi:MAG: Gfo/Idh/MocA family oxidoreductase [Alphaproteobacteria bacterium]|nr:Gfo/Idh/MocA family oxidoreductase [Alphaproteobacteria bacterium]
MSKVRYGMVGGGEGAFIGAVHRTAAAIAGNWDLVAGAFSSTPDKARRSAAEIGVARGYDSWQDMLAKEASLPADRRIHVVSIVTPNFLHAPVAIAAMEAGFDVVCDKPVADTLEAARAIADAATRTGRRIAITHTYTGYPLVKQARDLVAGAGAVRRVMVKYTQDWLSRAADLENNKQAAWRVDPNRSGEGGAIGDIGTHAFNLVEFITGRRVKSLCAELGSLPGRSLDDDASALLRLEGGGRGMLACSQVCVGDANDLAISVYCDELGLHWRQEEPNSLRVGRRDRPEEIWHAGSNRAYLAPAIRAIQRTPGGHPEGYMEAFANIYHAFGQEVLTGKRAAGAPGYATLEDAIACMKFIHAAKKSSDADAAWIDLTTL